MGLDRRRSRDGGRHRQPLAVSAHRGSERWRRVPHPVGHLSLHLVVAAPHRRVRPRPWGATRRRGSVYHVRGNEVRLDGRLHRADERDDSLLLLGRHRVDAEILRRRADRAASGRRRGRLLGDVQRVDLAADPVSRHRRADRRPRRRPRRRAGDRTGQSISDPDALRAAGRGGRPVADTARSRARPRVSVQSRPVGVDPLQDVARGADAVGLVDRRGVGTDLDVCDLHEARRRRRAQRGHDRVR